MLTFKHAFNSKNSTGYLESCHGKPFLLPLISNKLLSECVMVREREINELFPYLPKFSPKVQACVFAGSVLQKKKKDALQKKCKHISLYIYI